jgi:hypothetical protein
MRTIQRLSLMLIFCLVFLPRSADAGAPSEGWDALIEVTDKFAWYPRDDLKALLESKGAEYGQSLAQYRDALLGEITAGGVKERINPNDFRTGLPWRKYYRLSLAEFCLYLTTERALHLQNASAAMSVLAKKTGQPEIEFWNYVYGTHNALRRGDRNAFIGEIYKIWQNVILPFELETLLFPSQSAQSGFVRSLPFLYENVVHLVVRKGILEAEFPKLHPLATILLDIHPKLSLENGHKAMVDRIVERMRGVNSDNNNLNFAVALLEATSTRYEFEDERDETRLGSKYHITRKYYQLAFEWADTEKGKMAALTDQMGFMNYVIRRFGDRREMLFSRAFFNNAPSLAHDRMEQAFEIFDRLAASQVQEEGYRSQGFEDRETYLQGMHQLLDSGAKLAIVLSSFHRADGGAGTGAGNFAALRPLEHFCALFDRHAAHNSEALPDNAYFLAAFAAGELADLYRAHTRYSIDDRASTLAFAYQLQAVELFPLDLPGLLQLALQSTVDGRVRDYFEYSRPLTMRLRTSTDLDGRAALAAAEFASLTNLLPVIVPEVIENVFLFLPHFPQEERSEEALFTTTVSMARTLSARRSSASQEKIEEMLAAIGMQGEALPAEQTEPGDPQNYPYFELKSRLYASPNDPIHGFLRDLFHEVGHGDHSYVRMMRRL